MSWTTSMGDDVSISSPLVLSVYRCERRDAICNGRRTEWRRIEAGRRLSRVIVAMANLMTSTVDAELLEAIEELTLDTDSGNKEEAISREAMPDHLEIFVYLVRSAEAPEQAVRRRVHCVFDCLLSNFHPVAQHLLLSRLVELVAERTITVEMEPQVLAWLIDHYRKRIAANDEEVGRVFRDEISHFYGLLLGLTYDDMVAAHPFFIAILLLVREHATRHFNLTLLHAISERICERIESQLVDYLHMKDLQARNRRQSSNDENEEEEIEEKRQKKGLIEELGPDPTEQSIFVLELIKFWLNDLSIAIKRTLYS